MDRFFNYVFGGYHLLVESLIPSSVRGRGGLTFELTFTPVEIDYGIPEG